MDHPFHPQDRIRSRIIVAHALGKVEIIEDKAKVGGCTRRGFYALFFFVASKGALTGFLIPVTR